MENQKIARPWQPPNMSEGVAELIESDQLLHNLNIRGLASADSEEFRVAVENLRQKFRDNYSHGWRDGRRSRLMEVRLIAAVGPLLGAALLTVLVALFG